MTKNKRIWYCLNCKGDHKFSNCPQLPMPQTPSPLGNFHASTSSTNLPLEIHLDVSHELFLNKERLKQCALCEIIEGVVPSVKAVEEALSIRWRANTWDWKVRFVHNRTFLVHFPSYADAHVAINDGFLMVNSSKLMFYSWSSKIGATQEGKRSKGVWIRLRNVPLHAWSPFYFSKIVESFGKLMDVDNDTVTGRNLMEARVEVEVAEGESIPQKLKIVLQGESYWIATSPDFVQFVPPIGDTGEMEGESGSSASPQTPRKRRGKHGKKMSRQDSFTKLKQANLEWKAKGKETSVFLPISIDDQGPNRALLEGTSSDQCSNSEAKEVPKVVDKEDENVMFSSRGSCLTNSNQKPNEDGDIVNKEMLNSTSSPNEASNLLQGLGETLVAEDRGKFGATTQSHEKPMFLGFQVNYEVGSSSSSTASTFGFHGQPNKGASHIHTLTNWNKKNPTSWSPKSLPGFRNNRKDFNFQSPNLCLLGLKESSSSVEKVITQERRIEDILSPGHGLMENKASNAFENGNRQENECAYQSLRDMGGPTLTRCVSDLQDIVDIRELKKFNSYMSLAEQQEEIMSEAAQQRSFLEKLSEKIQEYKKDSPSTDDEHMSNRFITKKRLFGRQEPLHIFLGGGKCADIILWRNKQTSASIAAGVTIIWLLFEWIGYHLVTLVCHWLILALTVLFLWTKASPFLNREPPNFPEVVLPEHILLDVARRLRYEINEALATFRYLASGDDFKSFLMVITGLWAFSMVSSCFDFLTLFYMVFVMIYTIPVLYEKYEDYIDAAADKTFSQINKCYQVMDEKILKKIPKASFMSTKKQQ